MKRLSLILLVSLIVFLPGCGLGREAGSGTISAETVYSSDIPPEDCYLCGGGIENLIPSYWGQNNVALISLNTFEIKPIEINRYDRLSGRMIEEYAGVVSFGGGGSTDGGFSANLMLDYDSLSFRIFSIRHNADQKSCWIQQKNENKRRIPA